MPTMFGPGVLESFLFCFACLRKSGNNSNNNNKQTNINKKRKQTNQNKQTNTRDEEKEKTFASFMSHALTDSSFYFLSPLFVLFGSNPHHKRRVSIIILLHCSVTVCQGNQNIKKNLFCEQPSRYRNSILLIRAVNTTVNS